jgi:hypothetical protein
VIDTIMAIAWIARSASRDAEVQGAVTARFLLTVAESSRTDDQMNSRNVESNGGSMKTMSQVMIGAVTAVLCAATMGCGTEEDADVETKTSALTYGNCPAFSDDQACVCEHPAGAGRCAVVSRFVRFYPNISTQPNDANLPYLNDRITSIKVGNNISVYACQDIAWNGGCVRIPAGQKSDDLSVLNMNDNITSIRLDPTSYNCYGPGPNQVSIFIDPNAGGDCVVLDQGDYRGFDRNPLVGSVGGAFGLRNDAISSVFNGSNVHSIWYLNYDLTPAGSVTSNGAYWANMLGWNDQITSLKVTP